MEIPQYESIDGQFFALLVRKNESSTTQPCPFCGIKHTHGKADGHRVAHCSGSKIKDEITASDGTKLIRSDGYIVRTLGQSAG